MENKKLLSVRLDPTTLSNVEKFAQKRNYWKRNTVISHILDAVFDCFDEKSIYDMVRFSRHYHKEASGSFSLEKSTRSQSAADNPNE